MSTPEESLVCQDPDYISITSNDETQQKIYEENARSNAARKITAIVEKEFSQEIDSKEKEILQIQERLQTALKTLHLLRYVIITDFYNRKQCQTPQVAKVIKQTRIHPAVKQLLAKCPKFEYCTDAAIPSTSTDPRYLPSNESLTSILDVRILENHALETDEKVEKSGIGVQKKRSNHEDQFRPKKVPRYVPPKSSISENTSPSRGTRHKVRKRIIVGNISKWIPLDWRVDSASHKWTMYVRSDKEDADIGTFVSKVRFFLHPSYRPHDVVEVTSSPFYLSRRGWGEFPLRVQLHFKNPLSKPMDIIHHLKLDRTYTGLQTLGSETSLNVWIYDSINSTNLQDNNIDEHNESSSTNTSAEIEARINSNTEFIREQPVKLEKTLEHSKFETIPSTYEPICIKEEIPNSEMNDSLNTPEHLMLTTTNKETVDVKIKIEPDIFTDSSTPSFLKPSLKEIHCYIEHDHNYFSKEHRNFDNCIVKEGNVTIEHYTINNDKCDTTIMHKCNGDTLSSTENQLITIPNLRGIEKNNIDPLVSAEKIAFQRNNDQKNIIFLGKNKSIHSNDESNNTVAKILENNKNCVKNNTFNDLIAPNENTLTTINGFCKTSHATLDRLNNLQRTATDICNSHLKPLQITIPPLFTSSTSKRIVIMKDKKLIPVDITNISPSKSNENSTVIDGDMKNGNIAKLNVSVPHGTSLLRKRPINTKLNLQENIIKQTNKETAILTLKTANSLLLNVNYDEPVLKIADSQNLGYNYDLPDATKSLSLTSKQEPCPRLEDKNEKIHRTKITLGKDKYKIQSKKDLYEAVLNSIENVNITDIEALIRFIIRRLPIVTQDASDPEYKRLHPYTCYSEEDFFAHNVGKQRACEWYRAKTIRGFLQKKQILEDHIWSVKEIIIWARLHGYTPSRNSFSITEVHTANGMKKCSDFTACTISSTYTEPITFQKWLQTCGQSNNRSISNCNEIEDTEINIESVDNPCRNATDFKKNSDNSNNLNHSNLIPLELDESMVPLHNFVCNSARDIGIKIGPEEITPGVMYCATSRVIIRVIECFVEDLTRSSLAKAWERNSGNGFPKVITPDDVRNAIISREEFDIFTNEGLGSKQDHTMNWTS